MPLKVLKGFVVEATGAKLAAGQLVPDAECNEVFGRDVRPYLKGGQLLRTDKLTKDEVELAAKAAAAKAAPEPGLFDKEPGKGPAPSAPRVTLAEPESKPDPKPDPKPLQRRRGRR